MYKRDIFGENPCLTLELDLSVQRELTSFDVEEVRELKIDMYHQLIDKLGAEIEHLKEEIYHTKQKSD